MKQAFQSQYKASFDMLRDAVTKCSDALWLDAKYVHPFWRVAYHSLFFADLYLSASVERFTPWSKHVEDIEALGPMFWKGGKVPPAGPAYTKADIEAYCASVMEKMPGAMETLDLEAASGFPWLPFSKAELQIYNIRHVQHHTGQLIERIRQELDCGVDWTFSGVRRMGTA